MIEKQQKRSKFSYFGEQTRKQKLLKDYQSLRQSPCIKRQLSKQTNKKYQYDQTSYQKQNLYKIISFSNLANTSKQLNYKTNSPQKCPKKSQSPKNPLYPQNPNQFSPYEQYPSPSQCYLYHQYEQQFKLLKYQLKQFQYQNQLLKKKIQFIQQECFNHKQGKKQMDVKIMQMQIHIKQLQAIKQDYQIQRIDYDALINNMKHQIHILLTRNQQLQQLIQIKDHQILKLKTNIQVTQVTYNNNKRRKSLDLSIEGRARFKVQHLNQKYDNHLNQKYEDEIEQEKKQNKQNSLKKRSLHIGKLLNKTTSIPKSSQPIQLNKNASKCENLLNSIQSMFLKINKHPPQDLKQIWKWLKNIAFQNQSIKILKEMKNSLITVVQQLQRRKEISFIDREWHKLAQRILAVVEGWDDNQIAK